MRTQGESSPQLSGCQELATVLNTRSGCGIIMVTRPSMVVSEVIPSIVPPLISAVVVITLPNEPVLAISNLLNEPVDVKLPLTVPIESILIPAGSTTLNVPNEPVEVDEPLIFALSISNTCVLLTPNLSLPSTTFQIPPSFCAN